MVHDCYATHAADAETMKEVLRETFVSMYFTRDPLAELRDGLLGVWPTLEIPEPPSQGKLDVEQVLQSDYFFS